jgi:hypothetical protein
MKPDDEKMGPPISFRVPVKEHRTYIEKLERSGLTKTEFFREYVLQNKTQVVARPRPTVDTQRLLYLANKASNNLNQLAYRANTDHLAGTLDDASYAAILSELEAIGDALREGINKC